MIFDRKIVIPRVAFLNAHINALVGTKLQIAPLVYV